MIRNEDSRVKIPSILHLMRLGYKYISLKNAQWDPENNIFTGIFKERLAFLNPHMEEDEINRFIEEVKLSLANEDLGREFYEKLAAQSDIRMIDLENFDNNTLNVVTELPYKNDEETFRLDIILLINGLPLAFIEVKKPNNREGVIAERNRIATRFENKKFRRFVNITQLMVFSNNMEYDPEDLEPIQGAFYASPSYSRPVFNYFREEENLDLGQLLKPENESVEDEVLKDNNLVIIKHSPEFITNKNPDTPTNRLSSSLFSKERLKFILKYSLAYVNESAGIQFYNSAKRIEKLEGFNDLKNKGFYVGFSDGLLNPEVDITKEDFFEVKNITDRMTRFYRLVNFIYNPVPKGMPLDPRKEEIKNQLKVFVNEALSDFSFK